MDVICGSQSSSLQSVRRDEWVGPLGITGSRIDIAVLVGSSIGAPSRIFSSISAASSGSSGDQVTFFDSAEAMPSVGSSDQEVFAGVSELVSLTGDQLTVLFFRGVDF